MEGRLDELEADNEKLMAEYSRMEQSQSDSEWQRKKQMEILEKEVAELRVELKDAESKHKFE